MRGAQSGGSSTVGSLVASHGASTTARDVRPAATNTESGPSARPVASPLTGCSYVSPSASNDWGPNELDWELIPSEPYNILMVNGTYDLKIVDCIGNEGEVLGVELFEDTEVSFQF